ncbi:MAG: nucleotide exchange factor GrpE [Syntrophus sp. (in: bacteria)]|nr:nucleotide exchange factor GrpE [Syntrophus sp. (in: bacteria)]
MAKKVKMDTDGMNEDRQDKTGKADSTMEETAKASEEDLEVKMQEMEKKAAENYDKYVRALAELDNYKKRAVREKADAIKYGNENLLRDILPLVDNMDRAMEHACNSDDFDAFKKGLKMLQQQLLGCLQKHGVEQIEAVGKDFDPHVHEAMVQVESKEHEESKVVGEFERGYLLNGRLLRPSKVSVCRRLNKEDQQNCEEAGEEAKNN